MTAAVRIALMLSEGATVDQAADWVLRRYHPALQRYYRLEIRADLLRAGIL